MRELLLPPFPFMIVNTLLAVSLNGVRLFFFPHCQQALKATRDKFFVADRMFRFWWHTLKSF